MAERVSPEEAGYVLYADLLDRLRERFPAVPDSRLEQIVATENDAVTGGILHIVPAAVEAGATEMLLRDVALSDEIEVA